jgi:hypothetical protein
MRLGKFLYNIVSLQAIQSIGLLGRGLTFKSYWPPLNWFKSRGILLLRAFGKPRKSLSIGITREEMDSKMASL